MTASWKKLSESGATSIEYALIAALVSVAIFAAADALGSSIQGLFTDANAKVEDARN
jgi:pilus assembly protein Flp/PilA